MPSINLLPENFTIEAYKKKERVAVYALSVFFLAVAVAAYAKTEMDARQERDRLITLDASITKVKADIERNIEESNLLSSKYNKSDIEKLLSEHVYASRALTFLKGTIISGVYTSGTELSVKDDGDFSFAVELYAKDYDTLLNQSSVFQNSFWIKSMDMSGLKYSNDKGVSCTANLVLRKDYLVFHDQYRDFGADILAKNVNKYIRIDNYSVTLEKGKNGSRDSSQRVVVSFDGKSYDPEELDEFKKKLKETDNVISAEVNESSSQDGKPGVESFRGSATLKY